MKKIIICCFMLFIICILTGCETNKKYDVTFKITNNINDDVIIFEPEDQKIEYTIKYCDKTIYFSVSEYMLNDHPTLDGYWLYTSNLDFKHSIFKSALKLNSEGEWDYYSDFYPLWWGTYLLSFHTDTLADDWNYRSFDLLVHVVV